MSFAEPLASHRLRLRCDPATLGFETTAELADLPEGLGQERAEEALRFGLRMAQPGYNVFVLGEAGTGRHANTARIVRELAISAAVPPDICYIHNFDEPLRPRLLLLPAGLGLQLRAAMQAFVRALGPAIDAALDSDNHRKQVDALQEANRSREEEALQALAAACAGDGLDLVRSAEGLEFVARAAAHDPTPGGGASSGRTPDDAVIAGWVDRLEVLLREFPVWRRGLIAALDKAARQALLPVVAHLMAELRERFSRIPAVLDFLAMVELDLMDRGADWRVPAEDEEDVASPDEQIRFHRYQVNLLVDHSSLRGAPVIEEDNPGIGNLLGRVEHVARLGTPVTGYHLVRAGALHRARGGYLLVDAERLLDQAFAWEGLKRALRSRELRIEPPAEAQTWSDTLTLLPEGVPADIKVVLIGERETYYQLLEEDPDFAELFKVAADFEDELPRDLASERSFARLVATLARQSGLRALSADAVAELVEQGARWTEDAARLSLRTRLLADLMREADFHAAEADTGLIRRADILAALAARRRRGDRQSRKLLESMLDGGLLVATAGQVTGQINGLVVAEGAGECFGHAARITATVRVGEGDLVDIERETEMGGPLHSKGVLILSAFLAARHARMLPLALSASLVFEQSYHPVEGDSASLAELCALLSALADLPIRQSLAVTGSVNQFGVVQAVGGINEKIEGFFELCAARGLDGEHGVVIPAANLRHLMLRDDVVAAVSAGRFSVRAVENVDQAIEILTGVPAGGPDSRGRPESGSVFQRVARTLAAMTEARHAHPLEPRVNGIRRRPPGH